MWAKDCCDYCQICIADQSSEDQNPDKNINIKGQPQVALVGNKESINRLDATCIMLWQKICFHFVYIIRLSKRLRLRVMD